MEYVVRLLLTVFKNSSPTTEMTTTNNRINYGDTKISMNPATMNIGKINLT
jgi:hypothetical protein